MMLVEMFQNLILLSLEGEDGSGPTHKDKAGCIGSCILGLPMWDGVRKGKVRGELEESLRAAQGDSNPKEGEPSPPAGHCTRATEDPFLLVTGPSFIQPFPQGARVLWGHCAQ